MSDLRDPRWMILKAVLFVGIGLLSAGMLLADSWTWKTAALLGLCIWGFARAYYFAFYVIQHYIDPQFKFAGILSAVRHLLSRTRGRS